MTVTTGRFVATEEQRAAITHPRAPLLVVAGAGTGKTTVMAERILHLVQTGAARPDQVLGLTFTNKAAAELKRQVFQRLGPDADVTIATYHGFSARLVADHALVLDLHPATRLLDRAEAWQLLFTVFDEFRFHHRRTFRPDIIVTDALVLASRCADHLVSTAAVAADCEELIAARRWKVLTETAEKRLELLQVVDAYSRRKRELRLLDFGDQISLAARLLTDHPDVAERLRSQLPVVLLDEYQDTNYAQRVILERLYPPGSAITAVGDDMQSIYAFRGAHLDNILRFDTHFPPTVRLPLTENRRSGGAVVALANRIQQQVRHTLEKELRPLPGAAPATIECFLAADDREEADTIAADIAALGPPWDRHAVLCRKRRQLIPGVVAALEARSIPVQVAGSSGLLDRPEVVDLCAWLEVLAGDPSGVALLRLLRGPRYRIGMRDLAAIARHARHLEATAVDGDGARVEASLLDAVDDLAALADVSGEARSRLEGFLADRSVLARAARRLPVLGLCELVAEHTGLWGAAGPRGHENLLRFLDLAERFTPIGADPGVPAFLEYVRLLDTADEDLAETHLAGHDAVHVLTVHQAKGLEWDHVWVPGLAGRTAKWGIFPDVRPAENPIGQANALPWWLKPDPGDMPDLATSTQQAIKDELRLRAEEEEWRLFYVACTRARHRLVASAAQWYAGPAEPQGPSAFYDFVATQTDLVIERFRHEPPDADPKVAAMEARAAALRPARVHEESDGKGRGDGSGQLELFPAPEVDSPVAVTPARVAVPRAVSATALVSLERCPLQFYWSVVAPLPRRPSPAARLGTEVHRWIEERTGRPRLAVPEPGEAADGLHDRHEGAGFGREAGLRQSFLASPFAELEPLAAEAPFVLSLGGRLVRGRVDAVYERAGRMELVDYKTGAPPPADDPGRHTQLDVYAVAAVDAWGHGAATLRATYCWLDPAGGPPALDSHDLDQAAVDHARERLATALAGLDSSPFGAHPGSWCARCEHQEVCPRAAAGPGAAAGV